jgi:hypothetical protein
MRGKLGVFSRNPPPFEVSQLSSLTGWWDASDNATVSSSIGSITSAANGDAVARWDSKLISQSATNSAGGERPVYSTSSQNGLATVGFSSGNKSLFVGGYGGSVSFDSLLSSSGYAFFAVAKINSSGARSGILHEFSDNRHAMLAGGSSSELVARINGSDAISVSYSANIGTWKVLCQRCDIGRQSATIRINGSEVGSAAVSSLQNLSGAWPTISGADCNIGELIVCNSPLSDERVSNVESYLIDKWAIT